MKIELKGIQYAAFSSEETACYSATLYIDGKKAGHVSNNGQGGCDRQHLEKWVDLKALEAWIAANHPPIDMSEVGGEDAPCDLEMLCSRLLNEHLFGKIVKRDLSTKILCFHDKKILTWPQKKYGKDFAVIGPKLLKQYPNGVLLNERPLDEVIAAYKTAGLLA